MPDIPIQELLEAYVQKREEEAIKRIQYFVVAKSSSRIKLKLIYEEYINCNVRINQLVTEAMAINKTQNDIKSNLFEIVSKND